jgi:hypothetical protein
MANIYSSKITSKIFNDVLKSLSLDLFKTVVKSEISIDKEFQNNIPKAMYAIYSLLSWILKTTV